MDLSGRWREMMTGRQAEARAIPEPEHITSAWLTERLQAAGFLDADVERFTQVPVGTGQVGRCYRFDLEFARDPGPEVPRSVVAKFSSDDPVSRETGRARCGATPCSSPWRNATARWPSISASRNSCVDPAGSHGEHVLPSISAPAPYTIRRVNGRYDD